MRENHIRILCSVLKVDLVFENRTAHVQPSLIILRAVR